MRALDQLQTHDPQCWVSDKLLSSENIKGLFTDTLQYYPMAIDIVFLKSEIYKQSCTQRDALDWLFGFSKFFSIYFL